MKNIIRMLIGKFIWGEGEIISQSRFCWHCILWSLASISPSRKTEVENKHYDTAFILCNFIYLMFIKAFLFAFFLNYFHHLTWVSSKRSSFMALEKRLWQFYLWSLSSNQYGYKSGVIYIHRLQITPLKTMGQ